MLQSPRSCPSQKAHEVCRAMPPHRPGAQLPCLSKAVGWVGVSVAFCEGIFWGCRFCGAWDGACRCCFHFLHEQRQVHGWGELRTPPLARSASGVVCGQVVTTENSTVDRRRHKAAKNPISATSHRAPRHSGEGTVASAWRARGRGLCAQLTKVPAEILRPQSLPSCLPGVQRTLDPWPQGAQKQTVALCPWLPCWWASPWKPSQKSLSLQKKRPSLAWKWKRTWLTHFTGSKLILNRRPPMAWAEARTVSQIWAHCFSSICTLYTCKPNLGPGTKSALVRASGCPGMSWYKESHWLHWDKWAIAWQKLKFMEKGTFQGVVSWVTFSMATILKPIAKKWGKASDSPARKVFSLVRNTFQLQNMHLIQPPLFLHAFSHSFILCLPRTLCSSMYGKERKFQA